MASSAINLNSSIVGTLGGVTTGYIPKANGSQLTDSVMSESEGLVNVNAGSFIIGTTTGDYPTISFNRTSTTSNIKRWDFGSRYDTYFGSAAGASYLLGEHTDGTYRVPIMCNPNGDILLAAAAHSTNGNVGIGTTAPQAPIHSYKMAAANNVETVHLIIGSDYGSGTTTGFGSAILFQGRTVGNVYQDNAKISCLDWDGVDNDGALSFYTRNNVGAGLVENLRITREGFLMALRTYSLAIGATNRDLYIDNTGLIGYVSSTLKSKHNITPISPVDWLYKLRPVNFIYNNDETNKVQSGLIAEEVLEVKPDFVSYSKEGEPETVLYSQLVTPLLKAVQDQKTEIEILKLHNEELLRRLDQLEKLIK